MFCAHCGLALPDAASFCPRCGTATAAEGTEAGDPASAGPAHAMPPAALPAQPPGVVVPTMVPYAGFWRRLVAMFLDGLILTFVTFPFQWFMRAPVFGWMNADNLSFDEMMTLLSASTASILLGWLCSWLYFALLESSKLQGTLGKAALNISVTDLEGHRVSFGRATGRYFGKWLSGALFLIGYLIQPFTQRRQTLHDLMAGTLVMRRDNTGS